MTHNTDVSSIQQEAAELYLADWATPIPVNPNDKRPIGSGWENTKYNNIDEVYSVFSNHRGNMGALLKDDVVCIDLDALNISKEVEVYRSGKKQKVCFGLELLEAVLDHKFETNVIGRHTKPIGGVFVKSDFPMKRNNEDKLRPSIRADYTFQNEAFIKQNNSKAGTVETLHVGT